MKTRIAYDIHGTIDKDPNTFKSMFKTLKEKGNEIWIISGPPTPQVKTELKRLGFLEGIHYDRAIGVVSYLLDHGHKPTKVENENYWFNEDVWWESKAKICFRYEIFSLLDNEIKYAEGFILNNTYFTLYQRFDSGKTLLFTLNK